jgi:cysteinyl-tRNA synthetase
MLKLYNTLTAQVEEFHPLENNHVRMYVCGPTVYDFAHIGNFRTFLFADLLRRYLKFKGFALTHVMNITDIEDKIIKRANEEGSDFREFTTKYINLFFEDWDALGLERPEQIIRATDCIDDMVDIIQRLEANGLTYNSDGSTYYRIAGFADYGKLSKINFEGNIVGGSERMDADEYEKENARDFVLWKAAKPGEPSWQTAIGAGRPGWHIECSAMSMKALGETFDIHAGGIDLVFPHHENEIAQSEGATGKPFVKYWVHSEFLLAEGEKMSKSKGNYYTVRGLIEQGFSHRAIRYVLLSAQHLKQFNFTLEGLRGAETTVARLQDFRQRLREANCNPGSNPALPVLSKRARQRFEEALDDDLNVPEALAAMHDFVREVNIALADGTIKADDQRAMLDAVAQFDAVFHIFGAETQEMLEDEIQALVNERQAARKAKNFARSDEIRNLLAEKGIILEDTKDGMRWKRK